MSATNLTKNLKLSQFVASDKPSWLGDVNGDNKKIDDGYGVLAGEISKANNTASSAKSQSDANTQTLTNVNSELEDYGNRITALEAGGGTEQLEQRVNTLSTDVEELQTRADTFDENITQNGRDITSLKSRVNTIEPKVKTNEDNITSLNTRTFGLSNSVEQLTTSVEALKKTTEGTGAIAGNAYNQSQSNKTAIADINSKISNVKSIVIATASLTNTSSTTKPTDILGLYEKESKTLYIPCLAFGGSNFTGSSGGTTVGRLSLDSFGDLRNLNAIFNDVNYKMQNGYDAVLSVTKTRGNNYIDFIIKQNSEVPVAPPLVFTGLKCVFY